MSLDRAKAGMSRVYQGRAIVHEQSVRELATYRTIEFGLLFIDF